MSARPRRWSHPGSSRLPVLVWGCAIASVASIVTGCDWREPADLSAGLPVDSVRVVPGPEITWQEEPLYVVGAPEPGGTEVRTPLYLVRDARLRSDSGLVIVQRSVQSLLVFDRDGALRGRVGGDGDGPGEFRRVRSAALLEEDSILAWDAGLRRISVFDRSGELSEVMSLVDGTSRDGMYPLDLYMMGAETIVTVSQRRDRRRWGSGLYRDEHRIQFLDRRGEEIGVVPRIQGLEWYRDEIGSVVFYSYRLRAAGTHQGFFVGDGRGTQLTKFGVTGEPGRVLQLPIEREALSSAELSARLQEWVNETYPPERRTSALRRHEAAVSASGVDSVSAFIDLLSGRDGRLWLKVSGRRPDEPERWLVVDPETNEARWVRGHPGWTVLDATRGLVAALREDAYGVESVGVFELQSAERGR